MITLVLEQSFHIGLKYLHFSSGYYYKLLSKQSMNTYAL